MLNPLQGKGTTSSTSTQPLTDTTPPAQPASTPVGWRAIQAHLETGNSYRASLTQIVQGNLGKGKGTAVTSIQSACRLAHRVLNRYAHCYQQAVAPHQAPPQVKLDHCPPDRLGSYGDNTIRLAIHHLPLTGVLAFCQHLATDQPLSESSFYQQQIRARFDRAATLNHEVFHWLNKDTSSDNHGYVVTPSGNAVDFESAATL